MERTASRTKTAASAVPDEKDSMREPISDATRAVIEADSRISAKTLPKLIGRSDQYRSL